MKHYRIKITDLAEQDLENAGDHIAYNLKNPIAAINTVKGIREKINSLSEFTLSRKRQKQPRSTGMN